MAGQHVIDVTDLDFESAVIQRSLEVPVLVDFWAPWCGPCQVLGPLLEKLAEEHRGAFVLAKVNTDESPAIAQAFRIQSIPTVHLVKDGKVVDGFQGALPEPQLREFLKPHVGGPASEDESAEVAGGVDEAQTLLTSGRAAEAEALLVPLLEKDPEDAGLLMLMARAVLARGDGEAAGALLDRVSEAEEDAYREAGRLRGALVFQAACGEGGEEKYRARLQAEEGDLEARYALASCLASQARYEEALEQLLEVIKRDRAFQDGAARKAMVAIFELLGPRHDLVSHYRRQLVIYL